MRDDALALPCTLFNGDIGVGSAMAVSGNEGIFGWNARYRYLHWTACLLAGTSTPRPRPVRTASAYVARILWIPGCLGLFSHCHFSLCVRASLDRVRLDLVFARA